MSEDFRERGPWLAYADDRGVFIQSDDFTHDVLLEVTGDFRNRAAHLNYARELARRLTAATKP